MGDLVAIDIRCPKRSRWQMLFVLFRLQQGLKHVVDSENVDGRAVDVENWNMIQATPYHHLPGGKHVVGCSCRDNNVAHQVSDCSD